MDHSKTKVIRISIKMIFKKKTKMKMTDETLRSYNLKVEVIADSFL